MSNLKPWLLIVEKDEYETVLNVEPITEDYDRKKAPDHNWKVVHGGGVFYFKTKKSVRNNFERILKG